MDRYLSDAAPTYKKIAFKYAGQIDRGVYAPGERFLSVPRLAQTEGIARKTAQHVIEELRTLGKVETRAGSGTYVIPQG